MKNDVIKLIGVKEDYDMDGFVIQTESEIEIMADMQSATRSEAYQSNSIAEKVVLVASINYDDYLQSELRPKKVLYDGCMYKIVRTYRKKKNNSIELSLSEVE